jgi:pimeloyl-ACP methyl ester carboxylesterase
MTTDSGYVTVDGAELYWEGWGSAGTPLLLVHGGYGLTTDFDKFRERLPGSRRIVAVELDGHGHSGRSKRPFRWETLGDDIASMISHLGLGTVDLLGYSLGGGAALRCAIQHSSVIRKLVVVSAPYRRGAWYPEIVTAFDAMGAGLFEQLRHSPVYGAWLAVTPDPSAFPALMDSTGELLRQPYDWSADVAGLPMPVLLAYGDADSISPARAGEFFALLGGGLQDAGWDQAALGTSRLAILPGVTHYDIIDSPLLAEMVASFTA